MATDGELIQRFNPDGMDTDRMESDLTRGAITSAFIDVSRTLNEVVPEDGILSCTYKANMIEVLELAQMWAEKAVNTRY